MSVYLLPHYTVSHKDMTCSLEGFSTIQIECAECNTSETQNKGKLFVFRFFPHGS